MKTKWLSLCVVLAIIGAILIVGCDNDDDDDDDGGKEDAEWCSGYVGDNICCKADNPCNIDDNDFCDCGGYCSWETPECAADDDDDDNDDNDDNDDSTNDDCDEWIEEPTDPVLTIFLALDSPVGEVDLYLESADPACRLETIVVEEDYAEGDEWWVNHAEGLLAGIFHRLVKPGDFQLSIREPGTGNVLHTTETFNLVENGFYSIVVTGSPSNSILNDDSTPPGDFKDFVRVFNLIDDGPVDWMSFEGHEPGDEPIEVYLEDIDYGESKSMTFDYTLDANDEIVGPLMWTGFTGDYHAAVGIHNPSFWGHFEYVAPISVYILRVRHNGGDVIYRWWPDAK